MTKRSPLCTTSLALFCVATLAACGQQTVQPSAETTTLRLERLADGNLQYCQSDAAADEDCATLPYAGKCEVIEVDVDLNSGRTCERCTDADGTVTDRGCSDTGNTHIACTMVTIPEPDCAVCAYVNGAVIFSSCIVDQPQCRSDADCRDGFGHGGRCAGGECIYPEGCTSDRDCRNGESCRLDYCSDRPCLEGDECPPCYGRCVPEPSGCDLIDCAPGHHCEMSAICDSDPANGETACARQPVCVPDDNPDLCATVRCAAGHHCEVIEVCADGSSNDRPTDPNICSRQAACVPDDEPVDCRDDADCPADFVCREFCTMQPCREGDVDCGGCYGTCVPAIQNPCDDFACREGQHCELQEVQCVRAPCPPLPVCVDDPSGCQSDRECADGQVCLQRCPPCLPGADCPPCLGVCIDVAPGCKSNDECRSDDGQQGVCWEGACHFRFNCDASTALCDVIPPVCPDGQSVTVVGACYGPCVPDALCAPPTPAECKADADCPRGTECLEVCLGGGCDPTGERCDVGCWGTCQPIMPPSQCDSTRDCPKGSECAVICVDCAPDSTDCVGGCWGTCVDLPDPPTGECKRTGCSGQICAAQDMASTCEWRPEYACFDRAICEPQADGACGWTLTDDQRQCLENLDLSSQP